jgi:hypothetical protein
MVRLELTNTAIQAESAKLYEYLSFMVITWKQMYRVIHFQQSH